MRRVCVIVYKATPFLRALGMFLRRSVTEKSNLGVHINFDHMFCLMEIFGPFCVLCLEDWEAFKLSPTSTL